MTNEEIDYIGRLTSHIVEITDEEGCKFHKINNKTGVLTGHNEKVEYQVWAEIIPSSSGAYIGFSKIKPFGEADSELIKKLERIKIF